MVECITFFGNTITVPRESLRFRPSAYALVVHEGQVVVVTIRNTGKFAFPGGGVHPGETLEEALKREVREEAGLAIEVERFLTFRESFFHYEPSGNSWHAYLFYFLCRPLSFDFAMADQIEDDEAAEPRWVPLASLRGEDYQGPPSAIVEILDTMGVSTS